MHVHAVAKSYTIGLQIYIKKQQFPNGGPKGLGWHMVLFRVFSL